MPNCSCGACGVVYPGSPGYDWCAGVSFEVDWCKTHQESAWSPDECWKQVYGEDDHYVPHDSPCRIIRASLLAGEGDVEDG